jgi:two-component system OmpR family sensor kinase
MRRAATAARQLAAGRAPEKLPPERTTEAAELTESINDLALQLSRARAAERAVLLSVSHELRTPLTAVRGYAEAISDGTLRPEDAAPVIVAEANGLDLLVQDLLALARLDQGVLRVRREEVDLAAVCGEAARRFAIEADRREVAVRVEPEPDSWAHADRARVLQVVANLIDNALRVTPAGGSVTIRAAPARIVVEDTGPGIPQEAQPRAFERFHLHERQGSGDGAGIGLAIVRELTELMGGEVELESPPGAGARFTLTFPERGGEPPGPS